MMINMNMYLEHVYDAKINENDIQKNSKSWGLMSAFLDVSGFEDAYYCFNDHPGTQFDLQHALNWSMERDSTCNFYPKIWNLFLAFETVVQLPISLLGFTMILYMYGIKLGHLFWQESKIWMCFQFSSILSNCGDSLLSWHGTILLGYWQHMRSPFNAKNIPKTNYVICFDFIWFYFNFKWIKSQ